MDSSVFILLVVLTFLVIAGVLYARARTALTPILEQAAREFGGSVRSAFPGLPQWNFELDGIPARLTPMTSSTSSSQGGAPITVLDFRVTAFDVADLRIREIADTRRNVVPATFENGGEWIALEHQGFDARFRIHARDGKEARSIFLDPNLLPDILNLPAGADIHIEDGICTISVNGHPRNFAFLQVLITAARKLIAVLGQRGA